MGRRLRELTPGRSGRHFFGSEVRRRREQAGMTQDQLAKVIQSSSSHVSRVEVADYMPPEDMPARLDAAFGTDGIFGRLYELVRQEIHPDQYRRSLALEAQALVIEEYAGHTVPGIVQTEDYARELFRKFDPTATDEAINQLVEARMSRRARLRVPNPPRLSLILDEAVIKREVGGPEVMRRQLADLIDLADTPTTDVQVLPFAHGAHGLLGGSLTLLTLEDAMVAYEESITTGFLHEDPEFVRNCRRNYDRIRAYALSPTDSAAMIRSVMEELSS
ncbi:helix-turn-helix transcriptional regulator [Streptomyces sp. B1866]|uniref:helix-turn-helix domain-containing protein n=1 Tax=Streptomyces sp. B1866 TaxID=3075431 RepID=UPI00288C6EB8|nr:helix-turn-helix transcriptional regulator [Streptomyces sp. B1866]MDT3399079.1 helix-turn-helix transcriptional regulator [Streptomyces sp. B1866]